MQLVSLSSQATRVDVQTQLAITGKGAQFGPGVLTEASRRVVDLFAGNLGQVLSERSSRKVAG
jgi:carbon monoxide dehydrogenase subunit G